MKKYILLTSVAALGMSLSACTTLAAAGAAAAAATYFDDNNVCDPPTPAGVLDDDC